MSGGLKFTLALLLIVLSGWAWTRHERKANEEALAVVASELAGRPVHVRCQGFWAELLDIAGRTGEVQFVDGRPGDSTYLTRRVCKKLQEFRSADGHGELDCLGTLDAMRQGLDVIRVSECFKRVRPVVEAITTLTHEAMHLRGFSSEAQAQCYALQGLGWTAVRLGGTRAEGVALGVLALALQPALSSEYQSADCRPGGSLDLVPSTDEFPAEDGIRLTPAGLYAAVG